MGKECSQPFSVPIISDVEEMEKLWVVASPRRPRGGGLGQLGGVDKMNERSGNES